MGFLARPFALTTALAVLSSGASAKSPITLSGVLELDSDTQCMVLHGHLDRISVENLGEFGIGDTVLVSADFDLASRTCSSVEHLGFTYLRENLIASWRNFDFGCAELRIDPFYGIQWLRSEEYGVFGFMQPVTGHASGDSLRIVGALPISADCLTDANHPVFGCIAEYVAYPCGNTAIRSATWGRMKAVFR